MTRRSLPLALLLSMLLALLLSGCLLLSGEQTTIDLLAGSGNLNTTFVSAEGSEERTVQVSEESAEIMVIAIVAIESGDLQIDLLQPDGSLAFAVASQPNMQITQSSSVRSDEAGRIHYRVSARSARNGNYQLFFQQ